MAAFGKGQAYNAPYSEAEFSESKLQELSRDGYMPGDRPGTTQDNTQNKTYQLNTDNDSRSRGLNTEWHSYGGFSGPVHKSLDGFKQNAAPANNHPKVSSKGSWPSRGVDTATPDQGSPKGGFSWK